MSASRIGRIVGRWAAAAQQRLDIAIEALGLVEIARLVLVVSHVPDPR
jgi:hypothetical protein